jgi:glycosyltransferase involved in cell wall biosynthesis
MRIVARGWPIGRRGAPGDRGVVNVLFVNTATVPPLGADTWVHAQIMGALDRSTHDVHVACVTGPAGSPTPTFQVLRDIPDLRVRPVHLGAERRGETLLAFGRWAFGAVPAIAGLARLARYVRRHRIAVIHTSDRPRDALACVLLARVTGAKCVIHVHVGYGEWMSPLLKWALKRADALIAISRFVAGTLLASGHEAARIHVVLNGIDPMTWDPRADREICRREFGVPDGAAVIVTVCRLFPEKGPGDLIQALDAVRRVDPDVRLLIVGQEMSRGFAATLAAEAERLGLRENVVLTGRRDDIELIMAAADIYAMPSFGEPFGLVFLEAMAMELPVVALDSGGAPEVVNDGITGLLSKPGDIPRLAENLSELVRDSEMRTAMGKRGRGRVVADFTVDRMARDVADVYRIVAGAAGDTDREWRA